MVGVVPKWYQDVHWKFGPLFLILQTPVFAFLISFWGVGKPVTWEGLYQYLMGNSFSWTVLGVSLAWGFLWMRLSPRYAPGPTDPQGHTHMYPDIFWPYFCGTTVALGLLLYNDPSFPDRFVDNYHQVMGSSAMLGMVLSVVFYLEGLQVESDVSHLWRFFTGVRFYKEFLGVEVKLFITFGFATMAWYALYVIFYLKTLNVYGFNFPVFVYFFLMVMYIGRFFYWGPGLFGCLDVAVEHLGFYNIYACFGILLPLYMLPMGGTVKVSPHVSDWAAVGLLVVALWANYKTFLVDTEKAAFREAWRAGRLPQDSTKYIMARFKDVKGKLHDSPLLVDGHWAQARHLNYYYDFLFFVCSTLVVYCPPFIIFQAFFLVYILIFFVQRSLRDDMRCSEKYGKYWVQYCSRVPYRLVPGVL